MAHWLPAAFSSRIAQCAGTVSQSVGAFNELSRVCLGWGAANSACNIFLVRLAGEGNVKHQSVKGAH